MLSCNDIINNYLKENGSKIFEFKVVSDKIFIKRYFDYKYRSEVVIPSFVYGFSRHAFYCCKHLTKVIGTSELHGSLSCLFYDFCGKSLELVNFDTTFVDSIDFMFCGSRLVKLDLGDKFDTSSCKCFSFAFSDSDSLSEINLGDKFIIKPDSDYDFLFDNCSKLSRLYAGNAFRNLKLSRSDKESVFQFCNNLKEIITSNGVITIDNL